MLIVAGRRSNIISKKRNSRSDDAGIDDGSRSGHKITGRTLSQFEELSIGLDTLISILEQKGIINKREYDSTIAMRLHEISKATAFEELNEEI
jgi:hypothetical protein